MIPGWLSSDSPTPEKLTTRQEVLALVAHLIQDELTDKQRRALVATAIKDMPVAEVARRMDSNRNALYKLIHDARMRLKRQIEVRGMSVDELLKVFE